MFLCLPRRLHLLHKNKKMMERILFFLRIHLHRRRLRHKQKQSHQRRRLQNQNLFVRQGRYFLHRHRLLLHQTLSKRLRLLMGL